MYTLMEEAIMVITAKELRGKPGQIIEQAARGTEVVITVRGKKMARLVPYKAENVKNNENEMEDEIFGLWKNKEDQGSVEDLLRSMRKRRAF
jgi:prevent-host-death family protein